MLFKIHPFLLPDIIGIIPTIISEFSLIQFTRNKTHQKEKHPDNPAFLVQKPLTISFISPPKTTPLFNSFRRTLPNSIFLEWQQNRFSLVQKKRKKFLRKNILKLFWRQYSFLSEIGYFFVEFGVYFVV